jgi:hypothetical protein
MAFKLRDLKSAINAKNRSVAVSATARCYCNPSRRFPAPPRNKGEPGLARRTFWPDLSRLHFLCRCARDGRTPGMSDILGFAKEDDFLGDVLRMVGNALQALGGDHQIQAA